MTKLKSHSEKILINHIKRLQSQNKLLSEVLAGERRMRHEASEHYRNRLMSRVAWMFDYFYMAGK